MPRFDYLSERTIKVLMVEYKKSYRELLSELIVIHSKYARGDKLTLAEMMKYNRLQTLMKQIKANYTQLAGKTIREINRMLHDEYKYGYLTFGYKSGISGFAVISPKLIERAVSNQLTGYKISERVLSVIGDIVGKIRSAITQGLIRGESYSQIAKRIKEATEKNAYMIKRIIQTEAHRVQNQARQDGVEKAEGKGIKVNKIWHTAQDQAVRDAHQEMEGQVAKDGYFYYNGAKTLYPGGFGIPELDINCRCSVETKTIDSGLAYTREGFKEYLIRNGYSAQEAFKLSQNFRKDL